MRTDRRHLRRVLTILGTTCVVAAAAQAQQIVVITNPSITLSAGDLRDAYLGEKLLADGTPLVLLTTRRFRTPSSPSRQAQSCEVQRNLDEKGISRGHHARAASFEVDR